MKPPKTSTIRKMMDDDWTHHEAVRLYELGLVRGCDSCSGYIFDERCRGLKDDVVDIPDDFPEEACGKVDGGRDLCSECATSPEEWDAQIKVARRRWEKLSKLDPDTYREGEFKPKTRPKPRTTTPPPADRSTQRPGDPKACPFCDGLAWVSCKGCDGSGWIGCQKCRAGKDGSCSPCEGEGSIDTKCDDCKGSGIRQDFWGQLFKHKCRGCNGSKKKSVECSECQGDGRSEECEKCNGKGEVDCSLCSGQGKRECPECKGYGRPVPPLKA